jgi:hypothetical protein
MPPRAAIDPKLAAGMRFCLSACVVGYGVWRTRAHQEDPSRGARPAPKPGLPTGTLIDQDRRARRRRGRRGSRELVSQAREALKASALRLMREE